MDRKQKIAARFVESWSRKDVRGLLRLMHPQGSYFDAYWGETCSVKDLHKYLTGCFALESRWYRHDSPTVDTPNGLIITYTAFENSDPEGANPVFTGAEVITLSGKLIMTLTDLYCDPTPRNLLMVAARAEKLHSKTNLAPLGLSARTSHRVRERLDNLAKEMTFFLNPKLSVTQLADEVGCSVMHLFHVLEEEMGTTFVKFTNNVRAKFASTLLVDKTINDAKLEGIAKKSGFDDLEKFRDEFQTEFGVPAEEYLRKFATQ